MIVSLDPCTYCTTSVASEVRWLAGALVATPGPGHFSAAVSEPDPGSLDVPPWGREARVVPIEATALPGLAGGSRGTRVTRVEHFLERAHRAVAIIQVDYCYQHALAIGPARPTYR